MTYRTLMAYLQAGADNVAVLSIAGALAEKFDAKVIGLSACQPCNPIYEEGFAAGDVVAEDRTEIKRELAAAADQFHSALDGKGRKGEWRSTITIWSACRLYRRAGPGRGLGDHRQTHGRHIF